MVWVLVFVGIGVLGLVSLVLWAIWLWHKTSDLLSEFKMLGERAAEAAELASQIALPSGPFEP